MKITRILRWTILLVLLAGLAYGISYAWRAFPIISGYASKNMCSCLFVAGRNHEDVTANELGQFPLSLAKTDANHADSTVTASVFGFAARTAVYRKGLGCTLVVESSPEQVRSFSQRLATPPAVAQDSISWPTGNLTDTAFAVAELERVLDDAFSEPGPEKLRRTRAVIVVHRGKILAERYAPPFNKDSRMTGWSMTKSITNALIGILVGDGKLDLKAPAPVEGWTDERSQITLHHLMTATSGLQWEENYGGPSGATNMLFKKKDMGLYAAASPLAKEPGTYFQYSSGTTNIISRIIRDRLGDDAYYRFPYERLFYKIGMLNTVMEPDAGGTFVGSSYCFAPARDWARFGLLYLQDGVWNGERILPEGWVKYSTTPSPAAPKGEYGAQFWLNAGAPGNPADRYYPDVPTDLFWADGFEGQNVFVIPSRQLVVVKLSLSQGDYLDDNMFLAKIIAALPKTGED